MGTCEEAWSFYICAEMFLALSPLGERVAREIMGRGPGLRRRGL